MHALKGLWILLDKGEHYHVGQVAAVDGEYILVKLRPSEGPAFHHLYHIGELSCECRECVNSFFFDTEKELEEWITFINKPDNSNVITLGPTKPPWDRKR